VAQWPDQGRALIAELLALRRRRARHSFAEGSYEPVPVEGPAAESIIAFVRRQGEHWLLVAAPRLPLDLLQGDDGIALAPHILKDTAASAGRPASLWTVFARLCRFALLTTPA